MQCPNCGKEAINVNGKFVCLDCGVEINQSQSISGPSQQDTQPSLSNHGVTPLGQDQNEDVAEDTSSQPQSADPLSNANDLGVSPTAARPSPPSSEPVKDYYLDSLNKMSGDFNTNNSNNDVTPGDVALSKEPAEDLPAAPSIFTSDVSDESSAPSAEPKSLDQPMPSINTVEPAPLAEQNNTLPSTDSFAQSHPNFPPQDDKEIPQSNIPQESQSASDLAPQPAEEAKKEPIETNNFDAYSTPSGVAAEPNVSDLSTNQPLNQSANSFSTEETNSVQAPVNPTENLSQDINSSSSQEPIPTLDNLLEKYDTPANKDATSQPQVGMPSPGAESLAQSSQTNVPLGMPLGTTVDSLKPPIQNPLINSNESPVGGDQNNPASSSGSLPSSSSIPPVETVFGSENNDLTQGYQMDQEIPQEEGKKKTFIIIGTSVAVFILLIGLIFLGISLTRPKTPKPSGSQEGVTVTLSKDVSAAMDPQQDVVVNFDQSIDFSKATVKKSESDTTASEDALKLLFSKPLTAKGNWKGNKEGNFSDEASFANIAEKKIYIESEKATYIYSAESQTWNKTDGFLITSVPLFYGIPSKSGLFYVNNVNYLEDQGSEDIDGKSYKKIKVSSKDDFVKEAIKLSNAALSKTNFESINTENIEIFAWVDEENRVFKVSVNGNIEIQSDIFEGTISIKSEATYDYKDVNISKP